VRIIPLALLAVFIMLPSVALACGVYLPREGDGYIAQERALITWDGQQEEIVMELAVTGEASEAAWIIPVPAPATAELGDSAVFDALQEYTAPESKPNYTLFPGLVLGGASDEGVGAAPPVTVLSRQRLGDFDVATLAATDAAELTGWLEENGYSFPEGLDVVLQPYVDIGWYYVAIRIAPEVAAAGLSGRLDPVKMTFAADEIVYPMRPASMSPSNLLLVLYVLADHRVDMATMMPALQPDFAGWLTPDSVNADSPLTAYAQRSQFLTKYEEVIWSPATITEDIYFTFAPQDTLYRQVEYYDRWLYEVWLLCLCLPPLVLAGFIIVFAVRRGRKRPSEVQ